MTVKDKVIAREFGRGPALLAAGGLLGALAASSCCILPLALFGLGVSGAWIGNLTRLAPYQPIFIAFTLVSLGAGAWLMRRASRRVCVEGAACARPLSTRIVKAALALASLLVLAALGLDLVAPLLLNS
jgi:mercuric ion transport protein